MKQVVFSNRRVAKSIIVSDQKDDIVVSEVNDDFSHSKTEKGQTVGEEHPSYRGGVSPTGFSPSPKKLNKTTNQALPEQTTVEKVVGLAQTLTVAERKKVLDSLSLGIDETKLRDIDMWVNKIYEICQHKEHSSVVGFGPALLKSHVGAKVSWQPVADFMETTGLQKLKVVERQSIYKLLASLVVDDARRVARNADIPFSPKLIAGRAAYVGSLFDNSFPGYLQAGGGSVLPLAIARLFISKVA